MDPTKNPTMQPAPTVGVPADTGVATPAAPVTTPPAEPVMTPPAEEPQEAPVEQPVVPPAEGTGDVDTGGIPPTTPPVAI